MAKLNSFYDLKELKNEMSISDIINFDTGTMMIHRRNLMKYLEKYSCKDEDDLSDTLWYNYGMFLKILEN